MVMTWASRVVLMVSTRQASVVLLPLPAGPVKRTRPWGKLAKAITFSGMPSALQSGREKDTTRMTRAREPR